MKHSYCSCVMRKIANCKNHSWLIVYSAENTFTDKDLKYKQKGFFLWLSKDKHSSLSSVSTFLAAVQNRTRTICQFDFFSIHYRKIFVSSHALFSLGYCYGWYLISVSVQVFVKCFILYHHYYFFKHKLRGFSFKNWCRLAKFPIIIHIWNEWPPIVGNVCSHQNDADQVILTELIIELFLYWAATMEIITLCFRNFSGK